MKNMKRTLIIALIIVLAFAGGGGMVYYFDYQNNHYVSTDDAQVSADMITITPQLTGRIDDWTAKVGDWVNSGDIIGNQETDTAFSMKGASSLSSQQQDTLLNQLSSEAGIKSPISGKIIQVSAVKGQMASASTALAVVADTDHAYVTAYIKETQISNVNIGQKVDITFDAYADKTFEGTVDNIGEAAQSVFSLLSTSNTSGNYTKVVQLIPVKITIKDAEGYNLMPGINASVKINVNVY